MAKVCGAKNRSGGRCKNAGTGAGGRCKFHGGASLVGVASPTWKHGRHSKHMPARLAERYQEGLRDPDLLSLRSETALADARIGELLEAIGQTGNVRMWREARGKLDAFKLSAGRQKGAGSARVALQELDDLIARGLSAAATWDELREWLDTRRKLSETETKREKDLMQLVPINQMHAVMVAFFSEVKQVVTEREVLAHLSSFWVRLVGGTGRVDAGA